MVEGLTRRVGMLFVVVAGLAVASGVGLAASLRFPEVLLDDPSLGGALVADNATVAVACLVGLLACAVALAVLSRGLGGPMVLIGGAAGVCLAGGAVLGLVLLPLWANGIVAGVEVLGPIAFAGVAVAAPALLAAWTVLLVRRSSSGRVLGFLAAAGLGLTTVRSAVWALNTWLPVTEGLYLVSAVLTVLALLGWPVWIYWLVRLGRPRRLVAGLLGVVFVVAHAGVMVVSTPAPRGTAVPAVPSAGAAAFSVLMVALAAQISLPTSYPELLDQRRVERYNRAVVPAGATVARVDANGVAAERICATGATDERAVLYLHGGGFILPASNGDREFAATISRRSGACVLLPHYRLAPEHPFPAAVHDSVSAYRWLRQQGTPAERIAILGDSCGGTFTLATAIMLRDGGDALPAALVSLSGAADLTLRGPTHRSKAAVDTVLSRADMDFSVRAYLANADPRDPLVSPLFADPHGLPPTLLLAGTEEVLLSDSTRMADRLRAAGVDVRLEIWPGMPHDWPLLLGEIVESDMAIDNISEYISRHTDGLP